MRLGRPRGCLDGVGRLVRSHLIVTPHTHSAPERSGESLQTVQVLSAGLFGLVVTRRPEKLGKLELEGEKQLQTASTSSSVTDMTGSLTSTDPFFGKRW